MADSLDRQVQPGNQLTKSRSNRSQRSSGPNSPEPKLARLHSGTYLDDHSHHYHQDAFPTTGNTGSSSSSEDLEMEEKREEGDSITSNRDVVPEVGVETEDLEAGPKLEKRRTSRSVRDPNLVGWRGPEDPENPKNWPISRKWAATLVGKSYDCRGPIVQFTNMIQSHHSPLSRLSLLLWSLQPLPPFPASLTFKMKYNQQ